MSVFDATNQYVSWPQSKFQEPKLVADGIQLKKSISEIAANWWSEKWFRIIDEFGLGIRWERAKLYAERGQVRSIQIENGLVKASVQGSDDDPYRVMISVKTIPKPVWNTILQDLGRTSTFAIALASNSLPAEEPINRVFQDNGVLLFPDRQGELHTKCTCMDWSNPCKHIGAVYLLLGAEFDRDPFLLFKLRGLEQSDFFKSTAPQLSETDNKKAQQNTGDCNFNPDSHAESYMKAAGHVDDTSASAFGSASSQSNTKSEKEHLVAFWKMKTVDFKFGGQWQVPEQRASVPASLGEFPFWQGRENFLQQIHCAYESAPEQAKTMFERSAQNAN